jgi:hypothetical protein
VKKLIFLLLIAVALAGMVSAQDTAHPPGFLTLDVLSEYGVHEAVIAPDTVSAVVPLSTELQAVFLAQPETIDRITRKPQTVYAEKPDYWLLL